VKIIRIFANTKNATSKFTEIGIFGIQIYHLATLVIAISKFGRLNK
jgi:hypothetical protein